MHRLNNYVNKRIYCICKPKLIPTPLRSVILLYMIKYNMNWSPEACAEVNKSSSSSGDYDAPVVRHTT